MQTVLILSVFSLLMVYVQSLVSNRDFDLMSCKYLALGIMFDCKKRKCQFI